MSADGRPTEGAESLLTPGLLGREYELRAIHGVLDQAKRDGMPKTVIICGEAGIGKTALLDAVMAYAQAAQFGVAVGAASPLRTTQLVYGPIVDMVAELLSSTVSRDTLTHEVLGAINLLLHSDNATHSGNLTATRLFAAVAEVVRCATATRPLLLAFEDVQWADPATSDVLLHLTHRMWQIPVVIALTVRTDSAMLITDSDGQLAEMVRAPRAKVLELTPLPSEVIRQIVARQEGLPRASEGRHTVDIGAMSRGNPFRAIQLAMHLTTANSGVPNVSLLTGLDDLSAADRKILILLAICEEIQDLPRMQSALGMSDDELSGALRRLRVKRFLETRGGRLTFRHALLREAVESDALPWERNWAHGIAADLLLDRRDPARAGALGIHLFESGRIGDAYPHLLAGGRHAAAIWANAEAFRLISMATRMAPTDDTPDSIVAILVESAVAARRSGLFEESLRALDEANAKAVTSVDFTLVRSEQGQTLWATGNVTGALEAFQEAAAAAAKSSDYALRASILSSLARGLMSTGQMTAAMDAAHTALLVLENVPALIGSVGLSALITLAVGEATFGRAADAERELRRCLALAIQADDVELIVRCFANLMYVLGNSGRYETIVSMADEAVKVCSRYGLSVLANSTVAVNHVSALLALGRWDEAEATISNALEEIAVGGVHIDLHVQQAEISTYRGRFANADEHLEVAERLCDNDSYALCTVWPMKAERLLWDLQPAESIEVVRPAIEQFRSTGSDEELLAAVSIGLRALADLGEGATDLPWTWGTDLSEWIGLIERSPEPNPTKSARERLLYQLCIVEGARATGTDSAESWAAYVDLACQIKEPFREAYGRWRAAVCSLKTLSRRRAAVELATAFDICADLRAHPLAERIHQLAALGGVTSSLPRAEDRKGLGPLTKLTRREVEVLARLQLGETNSEIAKMLFISERTVDVHVSRILDKLRVKNRTQAAQLAGVAEKTATERG